MKVYPIVPRGYCKGVVRAIQMAKECAKQYPNQPIHILGMIVHNQYIVDALGQLGVHTIDHKGKSRLELLDEIDEGKTNYVAMLHEFYDDLENTLSKAKTEMQGQKIQLQEDITDIKCFGEKGKILLRVSGGTPDYTFNWSSTNGYTNSTQTPEVTDLEAEEYIKLYW